MLNVAAAAAAAPLLHKLPNYWFISHPVLFSDKFHDPRRGSWSFLLAAYVGQGQTCPLPVARIHG